MKKYRFIRIEINNNCLDCYDNLNRLIARISSDQEVIFFDAITLSFSEISEIYHAAKHYYNDICKQYKQLLVFYLNENNWQHADTITDIYVSKKNGSVILNICINRPGILIGSKGKFIDSLKSYLIKQTGDNSLTIEISEPDIFKNIYD